MHYLCHYFWYLSYLSIAYLGNSQVIQTYKKTQEKIHHLMYMDDIKLQKEKKIKGP